MLSFQEMIQKLSVYWANQGCAIHQGYDLEVGAGTFNPVTFLRCLGPEPYKAVYVEPSRRPRDGRYGLNPNRVQHYHQMQVIFKPSPYNIQDLYLGSLEAVGLDLSKHDIRFVHDDWENPTIGASGLGWEVWIDGMEATQFTYFQIVGGIPVYPITAEITYGLERLAMYLQQVDSIFDLKWTDTLSYGDIYKNSEWQWSFYNFEEASVPMWQRHFADFEAEAQRLIQKNLPIPAYDFVMKASHAFNILDARGSISVSERARIMAKIRTLAHDLAKIYIASRQEAQFPLLKEKRVPPVSQSEPTSSDDFIVGAKEDLLIEIGCEELPANAIDGAIHNFKEIFTHFLEKHKLTFTTITEYATPRRLALLVKGLSLGNPAEIVEKKGPKILTAFDEEGKVTSIGQGFFRACGDEIHSLIEARASKAYAIKEVQGQEMLFALMHKQKLSTYDLLAAELQALILAIDFPKKMRWGDLSIEFGRPIRWLVALLGDKVVPFSLGPLSSGRTTYGHRLHAHHPILLDAPDRYEATLKKHFVLASIAQRKASIFEQIETAETRHSLRALHKEFLVAQVVHLVEWPTLLFANFDQRFLQAPKEVLTSEMVEHQKYFPLEERSGNLAPHFLAISNNGESSLIREGHQKALSPRLADGLFLFEEDLKFPLSHFAEKLEHVTFHTELGSMAAKQERIGEIALLLHELAPLTKRELIVPAAALSKADLTTQLVGEFPHLQGVIGTIYAHHQHQDDEIALSIEEHWMPKQEKGPLPTSGLGKLLSLADKLDNLLSCFALGLKPSASSDPFALRRQAFGIVKILIEERLSLDLKELLESSFVIFIKNPALSDENRTKFINTKEQIIADILQFFVGRLRTVLSQMEFKKEEIEAVLGREGHCPYKAYLKLEAWKDFSEKGSLTEIYHRAKKILRNQSLSQVIEGHFVVEEERFLYKELCNCESQLSQGVDYNKMFHLLAGLQPMVTAFFDQVIVMAEESSLRANRIALLQRLLQLFDGVLDFSKL